jgi:hypothetical protein
MSSHIFYQSIDEKESKNFCSPTKKLLFEIFAVAMIMKSILNRNSGIPVFCSSHLPYMTSQPPMSISPSLIELESL